MLAPPCSVGTPFDLRRASTSSPWRHIGSGGEYMCEVGHSRAVLEKNIPDFVSSHVMRFKYVMVKT